MLARFPGGRRDRHSLAHLLAIVVAALAVATSKPAAAAPSLGFEQSLHLAAQRSKAVPAQRAAEEAARQMAIVAAQRPNPVLQVGINNLPVTGPDRFNPNSDFMTMRSVGVMQELTRRSKLDARSARYNSEAQAAVAAQQVALAELQRGAAQAWLDRYYQERMRELIRHQREQAQQQLQAAEAAYRGARGARADVFAARSLLALLDDRVAQADRDVALATSGLARWIGAEAAGMPLGGPPMMDQVPLHGAEPQTLVEHHPDLVLLDRKLAAAQADEELARADKQPDVTVQLMLSQRGPGYSSMASATVSLPLQWDQKNRQDREVAARRAAVEQLRAERDEMAREHAAELQAWLQQWQSDRERLQHYDQTLLPLAAERTQAALVAYRGGTAPLAAVLEARRAQTDTQMDRLRLEMDAARLWAQLNFLTPQTSAEVQR